jgi:SAM-dependent methyltransferase
MSKITVRPCPVCGGTVADVVHHQEYVVPAELFAATAVDIVLCANCDMCFADIDAVQESVDETYAEHSKYADTSLYEGDEELPEILPGATWDLDRLERTAAWLAKQVPASARVLDAGCATGALIGFLQQVGFRDLVGLDPSPVATAQVARAYGVPTITGSFITPPEGTGTFDVVVLSHVLEHIVEVRDAVAGLCSLVRPGGLVYIEVPDAARYDEHLVAPFHDFNTEHINHFSGRLLERLLADAGFVARVPGSKTVMCSPVDPYPAVFGLFEQNPAAAAGVAREPDLDLGAAIRRYVRDSAALLDAMDARLRATIGAGPVVVWGAGQLAMKLLAGPLRDARVAAIVDSSSDKWGGRFGDIPVVGFEHLDAEVASDIPILVASIHHQDSIVAAAKSAFPTRDLVTLR